jgi:hypothetical protein
MNLQDSIRSALGIRPAVTASAGQDARPFTVASIDTGSSAVAKGTAANFDDSDRQQPIFDAPTRWGAQIQAAALMPSNNWSALTPANQAAILSAYKVRFNGNGGQVCDVPAALLLREGSASIVNAAATGYVGAQAWPFALVELPYPVTNDGSTATKPVQLVADKAITPAADVTFDIVLRGMFTPPQSGAKVGTPSCG